MFPTGVVNDHTATWFGRPTAIIRFEDSGPWAVPLSVCRWHVGGEPLTSRWEHLFVFVCSFIYFKSRVWVALKNVKKTLEKTRTSALITPYKGLSTDSSSSTSYIPFKYNCTLTIGRAWRGPGAVCTHRQLPLNGPFLHGRWCVSWFAYRCYFTPTLAPPISWHCTLRRRTVREFVST